jgi:hypothetical protein
VIARRARPRRGTLGARRADLASRTGTFHLVLDGAGGPVLKDVLGHLESTGLAVTYGAMAGAAEFGLGDFFRHTLVGLVHSDPENERCTLIGLTVSRSVNMQSGHERREKPMKPITGQYVQNLYSPLVQP